MPSKVGKASILLTRYKKKTKIENQMKNTLLIPGLPPHWGSGGYATGTDTKQHKRNIQNLLPEECPVK